MRKSALVALALTLAAMGSPAAASHAPQVYCSESGDVCASTKKVDGRRLLRLGLAADYFDTYRLCVRAPDGSRLCKSFAVEKYEGGVYGDSVRWRKHFPDKGPGAYSVRWRANGNSITPRLGFHTK